MIIQDNEQQPSSPLSPTSPSKSSQRAPLLPPVRVPTGESGPPPSYIASISAPSSPVSPMTTRPYQYQAISPPVRVRPPSPSRAFSHPHRLPPTPPNDLASTKRARRRFVVALGIAFAVYFVIFMLVGSGPGVLLHVIPEDGSMDRATTSHRSYPPPSSIPEPPSETDSPDKGKNAPEPPEPDHDDGRVIECTTGDSWSSEPLLFTTAGSASNIQNLPIKWTSAPAITSYASFSLPLDVPGNYFLSRGYHSSGRFSLETNPDSDERELRIYVRASYFRSVALSSSQICILEKSTGELGLGIYTPYDRDSQLDIHFDVRVLVPTKSAPVEIEELAAGLRNFAITATTGNEVRFGTLVLATSNSNIHVSGTVGRNIVLSSSNGDIDGTYNVTRTLTLASSNGKIKARINAFNPSPDRPTNVILTTSNGLIDTDFGLYRTSENSGDSGKERSKLPATANGTYEITASTKNAPVNVRFTEAPVNNAIEFTAATSNGAIDVSLHPTFEGTLMASTSNAGFNLKESSPKPDDPEGRGRKRHVAPHTVWRNFVSGWIGWESEEKSKHNGGLTLSTSNSYITLRV